jgi:hypothetical protein
VLLLLGLQLLYLLLHLLYLGCLHRGRRTVRG